MISAALTAQQQLTQKDQLTALSIEIQGKELKVNNIKAHYILNYLIHHTELIQRNTVHISI